MIKRLFDLGCSAVALLVLAPALAVAALGIRLAGPGPVLYRAPRAGRGGRAFTMYKLRTMHSVPGERDTRITAVGDPRVFAFGRFLRRTKIDELPQLLNVLRGEMSIVGPRPEDPEIVAHHYAPVHWQTLEARPGLSSPGTLYHDTHCAARIAGEDPERHYLEDVLPVKAALDLVYLRRASFRYDLEVIVRTIWTILGRLAGRRTFPDPPELEEARGFVAPALPGSPITRSRVPAEPPPAAPTRRELDWAVGPQS